MKKQDFYELIEDLPPKQALRKQVNVRMTVYADSPINKVIIVNFKQDALNTCCKEPDVCVFRDGTQYCTSCKNWDDEVKDGEWLFEVEDTTIFDLKKEMRKIKFEKYMKIKKWCDE